jgi:hypothetical protein
MGGSKQKTAEHLLEPEPEQSCFGDEMLRGASGSTLSCRMNSLTPELPIRRSPSGFTSILAATRLPISRAPHARRRQLACQGDRESHGGRAIGLGARDDGVNLADAILELGRRSVTADFEAM